MMNGIYASTPRPGPQTAPDAPDESSRPGDDFAALFAGLWFAPALFLPSCPAGELASASAPEMMVGDTNLLGTSLPGTNPAAPPQPAPLPDPAWSELALNALRADSDALHVQPATASPAPGAASSAARHLPAPEIAEEAGAADALLREAASRDSASLASALAGEARRLRPGLNAWALKPLLAEQSGAPTEEPAPGEAATGQGAPHTFTPGHATLKRTGDEHAPAAEAPPVAAQTIDPIILAAESLARRESRTIRINLHPQELGQIEVHLTRDAAGRVSARLSAERETTRHILADSIGNLRDTMERAGLVVDQLDVSLSAGFGADQNRSSDGRHERVPITIPPAGEFSPEPIAADGIDAVREDRLLSLRA
jgi:hypothetical protein